MENQNHNSRTVAVGSDHAGFEYKEHLVRWLKDRGYTLKDFGPRNADSVDYPDFAHPVAGAVERGEYTFGLLLCGSANGVAITANKRPGIGLLSAGRKSLAASHASITTPMFFACPPAS